MFDGTASIFGSRTLRTRPLAWHLFRLCLALVAPVLVFALALAWLYVGTERTSLTEAGRDAAMTGAYALDREFARILLAARLLSQSRTLELGDYSRFTERAES